MLKIYPKLKSNDIHAHTRSVRVPIAATHPIETKSSHENCMTSETWLPTVPSIFGSAIHSTAAQNAKNTSMPTSASWQIPAAIIPAGLFTWQCAWLWRTACHIDRHHGTYGETIGFLSHGLQFRTGLRQRGEKTQQRITTEYLDGVLADFSGYIAADELYDGPFCVLSIVDNHTFKRLIYEVLDHNPTHEDKKKLPKLKRGRPSSSTARKAACRKKKQDDKIADLFEHRYLFVQHSLSCPDKKMFSRITRGLPNLRNLRLIMDQVYRLFDRRCRTETALEKLAVLRRRIRRFKTLGQTLKKLFTPNIEKALTFLDDAQLPSTSNAVERGYRRHRKMQKSIYRVRTQDHISQRAAIDMQRDEQAQGRLQTITMLHNERIWGDIIPVTMLQCLKKTDLSHCWHQHICAISGRYHEGYHPPPVADCPILPDSNNIIPTHAVALKR